MSSQEIKICPLPFARFESGYNPTFVPCCSAWLTDEYYSLEGGKDYWNGPAAQALRGKILKGDYSYCKRDQCQIPLRSLEDIKQDPIGDTETPISPLNLRALLRGEVMMPEGPATIELSLDKRCNLACPTCRSEKILTLDDQDQALAQRELNFLWKIRKSVQVIKMSGNSEIFFSADQRAFLKLMSKQNFPQLDHLHIITNGLLFNQKTMEDLQPGTDFIKIVSLSIDAGSAETYKETRGGDWDKLLENMNWMSELRKSHRLKFFEFLFVVRAANFRDMEQTVALAHRFSADRVRFIQFTPWKWMNIPNFHAEAIHFKDNPLYNEFLSICNKIKHDPKVLIAIDL